VNECLNNRSQRTNLNRTSSLHFCFEVSQVPPNDARNAIGAPNPRHSSARQTVGTACSTKRMEAECNITVTFTSYERGRCQRKFPERHDGRNARRRPCRRHWSAKWEWRRKQKEGQEEGQALRSHELSSSRLGCFKSWYTRTR
jgi:hypothetical protein